MLLARSPQSASALLLEEVRAYSAALGDCSVAKSPEKHKSRQERAKQSATLLLNSHEVAEDAAPQLHIWRDSTQCSFRMRQRERPLLTRQLLDYTMHEHCDWCFTGRREIESTNAASAYMLIGIPVWLDDLQESDALRGGQD